MNDQSFSQDMAHQDLNSEEDLEVPPVYSLEDELGSSNNLEVAGLHHYAQFSLK
jgi:hypothetical protein